ncbi:MAG TPA: Na+/H+ antiporter subunit D [Acidimicrobiales bacterium]
MRVLLPFPVVVPILFAALTVVFHRSRAAQRGIAIAGVSAALGAAIAILVLVERDGPQSVTLGGWPAVVGIALVADLFSALLLVVSLITVLAVLVFAVGQRHSDDLVAFHPTYLALTAAVSLSFLTGDLFNLFVSFEVMLAASYVLITLGGRRAQIRHGMTYVIINMIASALFLTAIAFIYAAMGTVNLADLSEKMGGVPEHLVTALSLLFLVVFGTKAAVFPVFSWLPDSYPTARAPVVAVFAGLLTKVGVYAMVRTQTLLFPHDGPWTVLLVLAGLTMIVGVLGAIAQNDMKRILSFHIVSQIGYMVLGLGLFTVSGVAGAVFFIVHQIPVKTSLFLVSGLVEESAGSTALDRVGGLLRRTPLTAALFGLAALSLAGIPPFSGFVGKLSLVEAGFGAQEYAIVAVSLVGSLLTLFSMAKIWNGVFWGVAERPTRAVSDGAARLRAPILMTGSTIVLVGVTVAIAVFAGPIYDLCHRAADSLLHPAAYVDAVLGR